jgi:ABC-type branched-subunit amino acid transport system substrate-binding protein
MTTHPGDFSRRRLLQAATVAALAPAFVHAQSVKSGAAAAGIVVAQLVDSSPGQLDVSRDFLIGSRAAWQDINAKGGIKGRPVFHRTLEVDGTAASVAAALQTVLDNPSCVVLSGTAGDPVATLVAEQLRQLNASIAHVAPWLQNSSVEVDERTFPIFAARQEQIGHALKSLTVMGIQDLGVVYASPQEAQLYQNDIVRIAQSMGLKLQTFRANGDVDRLGQRLTPGTPAVLLFVGGTPELVQFTQGLDRQQRQRYVVALADVNLQTMIQMGAARSTPVIATQAVPMVNAGLPVVRTYREVMAKLFDEPPVSLSLAGFIAARYTFEVLREVESLTRQAALRAFQRREPTDIGGFRVAFNATRRSGTYVTQSMLTHDGRVIG